MGKSSRLKKMRGEVHRTNVSTKNMLVGGDENTRKYKSLPELISITSLGFIITDGSKKPTTLRQDVTNHPD